MTTQKLKIEQIDPNAYNPNRMSVEQFEACVAEIKSHGDVLKPVVVRPAGDRYEIVDGEHSWRAAMAAGLKEFTCQIVDVDDFEAMRQTLVRNEHGTHNPVREAMVYQKMMEERQLSNRELAKLVGKAEATIRNRLKYLEAYEHFEAVGDDDPIERIGSLTQAQVDMFLQMPLGLGKKWLAANADMRIRDWVRPTADQVLGQRLTRIADSGLVSLLSPKWFEFRDGIERALALADWAHEHLGAFSPAADYLKPVMHLKLPVEVLDTLPRQIVEGKVTVLLPAEEWATLMGNCRSRADDDVEAVSSAHILVRRALRKADIDPMTIASPQELAQHELVLTGPELIRDADFLTIAEQFGLAVFIQKNSEAIAQEAVRMTVDHFRERRAGATGQRGSTEPPAQVHEVLQQHVDELRRAHRQSSNDAEPLEALVARVTSLIFRDEKEYPVVDEQVCQLLQARLASVPRPKLVLFAELLDPASSTLM